MKFRYNHFYKGILAICIALLIYYFMVVLPQGELGQKSTWAALQAVELKHRNDANSSEPIIIEKSGQSKYNILGIPTRNSNAPRVWLILDSVDSNNKIFILPENELLTIKCEFVEKLKSKVEIHSTVIEYLLGVCSKR